MARTNGRRRSDKMNCVSRGVLPKLYDSSEDAAFDDDEDGEEEVTRPNEPVGSSIRSFFHGVVAELEEKTRKGVGW